MECKKMVEMKNGYTVRCGQCMPCRITRKTEVSSKMILEYIGHDKATFLTLTYAEEFLPEDNSVQKHEIQKFIMRYREHTKRRGLKPVRYLAVGEYGGKGDRAHYHAVIFGHDEETATMIAEKAWKYGFITSRDLKGKLNTSKGNKSHDGGQVNNVINSMKYTISYTIKKMTNERDMKCGREPEFALWSRNPIMGDYGLELIAKHLIKQRIYPIRSADVEQKYYIERELVKENIEPWNGVFYMNNLASINFPNTEKIKSLFADRTSMFTDKINDDGVVIKAKEQAKAEKAGLVRTYMQKFGTRMTLDANMMKILAKKVDSELYQRLENIKPMLKDKRAKAYEARIKDGARLRAENSQTPKEISKRDKIQAKMIRHEEKNLEAKSLTVMEVLKLPKYQKYKAEDYIQTMLNDRAKAKEIRLKREAEKEKKRR